MDENLDSEKDKTEEPSINRIEEFRKHGEVAISKELNSILILLCSTLTLFMCMVYIYEVMADFVGWLYKLDFSKEITKEVFKTISYKTIKTALICIAPVAVVSFLTGIISNVMQVGFLFSTEVLKFKPERIDPVRGMKRLFSIRSFVELVKNFFKFLLVLGIVYFFVRSNISDYGKFLHVDFIQGFFYAQQIIVKLMLFVILGLSFVAAGDFIYQKMSYRKKLMMTKDEAKRETKEKEGNPEVKQRIRSIQRDIVSKKILNDAKTADVIITNPTHISVALKYDQKTMISPKIVAKGMGNLAIWIREIAKEKKIPIVENVLLARAMYKTIKIGQFIPDNLYKPVAEVLAFVYKLKKKNKALSSGENIQR